jgi:5'-nucleotidase
LKRILITNDDGFDSIGIKVLAEALKDMAHITVVAPTNEKSACGHSLTLTKPLRFIEVDDDSYKLDDGTPSDCVYLALNTIFDLIKPDLVISGINLGANMGEDITYSGTAAGAMEAVLQGIPAIAISQICKARCKELHTYDFTLAKHTIQTIVKQIFDGEFPLGERRFLNINVPNSPMELFQGFKVTKAGYRLYANDAHVHRNPRGEEYYWLGLHNLEWIASEEMLCDFEAVYQNYVSITPIKLDMTSYEDLEKLKKWL